MADPKILVIEDNPVVASAMERLLRTSGYQADTCTSGTDGEEAAASGQYNIVLLDGRIPDRDGLQVCRNLRRRGAPVKILMVTARTTLEDKVVGLNAGADDYLTKPFAPEELIARVKVLARCADPANARYLRYRGLELDLYSRTLAVEGEPVHLSTREFSLLELFMRNVGKPMSRSLIAQRVWDMPVELGSNVIDVYMSSLRRKIDSGDGPSVFKTIRGVGFMLGEPQEAAEAEAAAA